MRLLLATLAATCLTSGISSKPILDSNPHLVGFSGTNGVWNHTVPSNLPVVVKPTPRVATPIAAPKVVPIKGAKVVTYIDYQRTWGQSGADYGVPGTVPKNSYNVVNLAFWLSYGAYDAAYTWTQLDAATRQSYIDSFHAAGVNVLVSVFGSAEWPVTGYKDPVATANNLAAFIKTYGLDGADVDWEDNNAMEAGTGEKWLISFHNTLRAALPSPYIITHAPQAPYFFVNPKQYPNGAYNAVHKAVGSTIDWYNVQFYNQGTTKYDTCDTLLNKSDGFFNGTSLYEIANNGFGIPANKLIIGKPVTPAGASNTGYMDVSLLANCLKQAKSKGWNGGAMGWQYSLDTSGTWSNQLASALQ
ncbi:hypothetical protein K7432_008490 [Basidiobolus ranarum]|uniref:GH18 domain-containing protein n=1 Tax=Basidiobolus ranarum TaxID=34480 RepID=A0ABR2VYH2_9FUNG